MSDASRFGAIEALFDAACELSPGERAAYLDRACTGDPELRAEVESLLACLPNAGEMIEDIVGREASRALDAGVEPRAERRLGPYRLVREIGRGGMGAVYLAVRDDGQYHSRVAIKVLCRPSTRWPSHTARTTQIAARRATRGLRVPIPDRDDAPRCSTDHNSRR